MSCWLQRASTRRPGWIGIGATHGIDWVCHYPKELEHRVLDLIGEKVWVRGVGARSRVLSAARLRPSTSSQWRPLSRANSSTDQPIPLLDLLTEQEIERPPTPESSHIPGPGDRRADRWLPRRHFRWVVEGSPELLLCDTSYLGIVRASACTVPQRTCWRTRSTPRPPPRLAISVITLVRKGRRDQERVGRERGARG